MKNLFALIVILLVALTMSDVASAGTNTKDVPQKFSQNTILSLKMGLNSDNKGVIIGCAMIAGDYRIAETVDDLAKLLNSDHPYDIKSAAVFALYQIQCREAIIALKKACMKNTCPFLKQSAEVFLNHFLIKNPEKDIRVEENFVSTE
jgi:hypothetical protein